MRLNAPDGAECSLTIDQVIMLCGGVYGGLNAPDGAECSLTKIFHEVANLPIKGSQCT